MQDRGVRRMIGIECEFEGLYHLALQSSMANACATTMVSPLQIHSPLGHPHLPTLQQMVPSLSSLTILECKSCQLGEHVHSSYSSCALITELMLLSILYTPIFWVLVESSLDDVSLISLHSLMVILVIFGST